MSTSKPYQVADRAAEALRELNHLTLGDRYLAGPADIYGVLGVLAVGFERLPQACRQMSTHLAGQLARGRLRRDSGGPVAEAMSCLEAAQFAAHELATELREAQRAISDVALIGEDDDAH